MTFRLDLELLEFVHRSYAKGQSIEGARTFEPKTALVLSCFG